VSSSEPPESVPDYAALNRAHWDEVVPLHARSDFYDVAAFEAGRDTLHPPELEALGDVAGKRILHLQCHFGLDTLSLARRGAIATGVDFSEAAVAEARALAARTGLGARFVCADVLALDGVLDERFDVVFSSWGVLGWLSDLGRWANAVAARLNEGGRLCLVEFHPVSQVFVAAEDRRLTARYRYFYRAEPDLEHEQGTYAEPNAALAHPARAWWCHSLGDVVTAVANAGLRVERLVELPRAWDPVSEILEPDGEGAYRLRGGLDAIPLSFVLVARR
jgi:2-polyprenyl-3-methyl-5-hydroxy-6-metoxy-1,4-benzoquinol methylase